MIKGMVMWEWIISLNIILFYFKNILLNKDLYFIKIAKITSLC